MPRKRAEAEEKKKAKKPAAEALPSQPSPDAGDFLASPPAKKRENETRKPIPATLIENRVVVEKGFSELEERSFGKRADSRLELSFTEALYLSEKRRISMMQGRRKLGFTAFLSFARDRDPRIHEKYAVYKDLRGRGLVVKTGFKFGCDFRVYRRGVTVKRGPKTAEEHTKWIVYAVPEDYTCSFQELSRAVRLAHSIRATMLWAIVDNDGDITYYEIVRFKP